MKPRYQWNKKCPDCGAKVIEDIEDRPKAWSLRVEIDCTKCSYSATAYLLIREREMFSNCGHSHKLEKPRKEIWSETISPLKQEPEEKILNV